ncbi:LPXTG cell wall anchor domain-containing protein [Enterococcus faecalis]|uniref:LPXTG cell wall anchor domain-containing protein n=1 Tax=Enterococcus faecalis TaxID=1351 RepID=UPI00032F7A16|nr:LPXTG cell wall anchor domain-containing protein [Enterococcus faecalis]EOJ55633.1 LPXTG-domain-containing protein cell wall anchor domain [Enterococcus faecalis EnGen0364]
MIKKIIMSLLLFLTISISLSFICVSVFADEIESKVTVRIIHGDPLEPEKQKESTDDSSKQKYKESNTKLNKKNRLPQTNEHINSSILIIGVLVLLLGIVGIYIYNKRNGEDKIEKD